MQIDVPTLTKMVNEMKYDLRIFFAARYLQRWWRIKSLKLLDSRTLHIRNAAASKLQHMWKVFRWRQMQHKITNHKSNKASVQIQKFMLTYIGWFSKTASPMSYDAVVLTMGQ